MGKSFHVFADKSVDCVTAAGPGLGMKCIFPFTFLGVTHDACTSKNSASGNLWCSTKVNNDGVHISGGGHYGDCSSECPVEG